MSRVHLALLAALALVACATASRTADEDAADRVDPVDGGARGPDVSGSGREAGCAGYRYHAFLASGSCKDVVAKGGTWSSRPAFPDSPPAIHDVACTFDWASTTDAAPDVDALMALGAEHLTRSIEAASTCDPPASAPASLELVNIVQGDAGISGTSAPTGVTGCDVCGRVLERQIFVILPEDEMHLRTLVVGTSSGELLTFDVKQPAVPAQVFTATLPPLPENGKYESGRIALFEKAF